MIPRAVLWDVDGTLIDSAEYHWLAWREAMAAEDYVLTYEQFAQTFGWRNDAILREFFGREIPLSEARRISDAKERRYRDFVLARGIELLPGVRRWLDRLKAAGWKQAIASSAPRPNVDAILSALQMTDQFDAIVSAEDVVNGKPHPQVFLLAAERVAVPPARCIVIEDAPAGIEGARRANMRSIGVGPKHAVASADYIVPTLDELDAEALERLVSGNE